MRARLADILRAALLTGLLALTPLSLPAQETASQPEGTIAVTPDARTDAAIRDRIRDILSGLEGYDDVTVSVDAGIVTLGGTVLDGAALDRLDRLVARVDGVVEIENKVQENTDLGARFTSVAQRFRDRLTQWTAFLPLLGVALVAAAIIIGIGGFIARLRQPWRKALALQAPHDPPMDPPPEPPAAR